MGLFLQRLIDGVSDGVIYGLVALALVLVYRATGLLNFAQGEMAMFSTFVIWWIASPTHWGQPIAVALVGGVAFGAAMGAATERFVIRPFSNRDHLTQGMVTMGLFLGLNALAGYVFSVQPVPLPSALPGGGVEVGSLRISWNTVGLVLVLVILSVLLRLLLLHTKLGLAFRAATSNPESARLSGINVDKALVTGWALAGAVGALAGGLLAPTLFVSPEMMRSVLLYAFAAAIVGGINSAFGATIGGLLVGVTQHLAGGYLVGSQLQTASALVLILGVLLIKPAGLFGRLRTERV